MSKAITIVLFEDDKADGKKIEASIDTALVNDGKVTRFDLDAKPEQEAELKRPYEDRIRDSLGKNLFRNTTLLVTDRDLSKNEPFRGLSEAVVSRVADELGFPIALYARGVTDSVFEQKRQWGDGRVILNYGAGVQKLGQQVATVARGFAAIERGLAKAGRKINRTPAKVMANLLQKPNLSDKIALYGAGDQGMFNEILLAAQKGKLAKRRQVRVLGYWLWDSILRFPGLLLGEIAAASYLNIAVGSFKQLEVQKLFSKALYDGPFTKASAHRWWWRADLDELVVTAGCADGRELVAKRQGRKPPPCHCSVDPSLRAGYFCMLTQKPVSLEKSKTVTWFPPGADLARVAIPAYEERGPWLGEF
jgi:hypothetical protein